MSDEDGNYVESLSSNIDDKTLHEHYMWPFQDAVRAGTVSVMCSYNRLNNSYACQNSKLLNGHLKEEMGFQGYVMTDWFAQHGGIASANAGLDMVLPISHFWGSNLTDAIANGTMNATRLDDMATRILASWYILGQDTSFPPPGIGMPYDVNAPHQRIDAKFPGARETLTKSAIEGQVLVKNVRESLPLKSPRMVSVFGYDAKSPDKIVFNTGLVDLNHSISATDLGVLPYIQENHTLSVGGGSGDNSPAYVDAPINALQRKAQEDGSSLLWDLESQDPAVNPTSDVCLVFINAFASEAYDRQGLSDEYSDTLVTNVANKCNNTIVVVHNAGIRLVDAWIEHENVTGLVYAHLPGQDTGRAIVDLLYGKINPSGRLPYTVARKAGDYGHLLHASKREGMFWRFPQSDFTEGTMTDYRAFDSQGIEPRYEFGFGLSYTTFDYSGLLVTQHDDSPAAFPPDAQIEQGGNPHLWDEIATISVVVANSGTLDGSEVAQLYLGIPGGPVRQLRGFEKVHIPAGEEVQVAFTLTRRDLSVWDVASQQWWLQRGDYKLYVGRSSRDLPLQEILHIR
jgi:beta-glucosidase